MLIKEPQLNQILEDQNQKIIILLYGPNEGLIRENYLKIKNIFSENIADELIFTGKSIIEKPTALLDEIRTVSMFNEKKIILIENPSDKNIPEFESAFEYINNKILIVITAGNLTKSSKIRKFFEGSKTNFSYANYDDDLKENSQLIQSLEKSINKVLSKDIKKYLSQSLSNDRMISRNEIEKIILYYQDNKELPNLENIKLIFNNNSDLNLSKISQLAFSGQPNKMAINLNKMFSEGISPIAIIKVMLNYVQRIQATQISLKKNNDFESAIKSLKPPVFWKDKDSFKQHCNKWPISQTIFNFNLLIDTELNCKSDYSLTNILCERALINIAVRGQKYF